MTEAEVKPVVWNMFLVFLIGKNSLLVLLGGNLDLICPTTGPGELMSVLALSIFR